MSGNGGVKRNLKHNLNNSSSIGITTRSRASPMGSTSRKRLGVRKRSSKLGLDNMAVRTYNRDEKT